MDKATKEQWLEENKQLTSKATKMGVTLVTLSHIIINLFAFSTGVQELMIAVPIGSIITAIVVALAVASNDEKHSVKENATESVKYKSYEAHFSTH